MPMGHWELRYSMAGVVLIRTPVDLAQTGVITGAGVIKRPRSVATSPWQHAWRQWRRVLSRGSALLSGA